MRVILIRSNLKDAISAVEKLTGENLNLPILKNILFEAQENKIKLTATNLEAAITYSIPGKVIEEGKISVPANIISGIVNNIQTERLNLEKKGNKLEVKTDTYEASIQGASAEEFPITPKIKDRSNYIEIKGGVLKDCLSRVMVASQFSDLRPELNSVFVNFLMDSIKFVTTDSFRLAEKTISDDQFNTNHKNTFSLLLPLKTAQDLLRVIKEGDVFKIYNDENQILFKTDQIEILSRLIDGSFPEYEAIIPKKFSTEITVGRQEFLSALKLAGVLGSKSSEVRLVAKENKKILEINSSDQAIGENKYLLSAKLQGKTEETIFNWRYITDALKALTSEEIFFGINGESEPAEIKAVGDSSYLYILKPITA